MLDAFVDFVEGRAVDLADVEAALAAGANINARGPSKGPYKGCTMLVSAPRARTASSQAPRVVPAPSKPPLASLARLNLRRLPHSRRNTW